MSEYLSSCKASDLDLGTTNSNTTKVHGACVCRFSCVCCSFAFFWFGQWFSLVVLFVVFRVLFRFSLGFR